jgi:hypothetical protein
MTRIAALIVASALAVPLAAQWIDHPTPGIPRTADGKPHLAAPAPRTPDGKPDLSGLWRINLGSAAYTMNITSDLEPNDIQPWAEALFLQRMRDFGKDDPWTVRCLPLGPRHITNGGLAKIIQTPGLIAILYEDLAYRQIFMDGRALPVDPNPSWMGYSVGHWDGDALAVETIGFNDTSWLDMGGHPHTEALKITERFQRRSFGRMELQVTLEDPKAYAKPWTVTTNVNLIPDTDLLEYVCAENERDRSHMVGRTEDEKQVKVAPEILASYVGVYDTVSFEDTNFPIPFFPVTLLEGQLYLDLAGKGRLPMTPLTETTFSPRLLGTYEFLKNDQGVVTHMVAHATEGDLTARKRPAPGGN